MPTKYVEPALVVEHNGVNVYHAYNSGDAEDTLQFIYSTSFDEDEQYEFDVREINLPEGMERMDNLDTRTYGGFVAAMREQVEQHKKIIVHGLETQQIEVDPESIG